MLKESIPKAGLFATSLLLEAIKNVVSSREKDCLFQDKYFKYGRKWTRRLQCNAGDLSFSVCAVEQWAFGSMLWWMGWEGETFLFLLSLVPVHTRRYGLDFLVIHCVTPNWMFLRVSCERFWTLKESSRSNFMARLFWGSQIISLKILGTASGVHYPFSIRHIEAPVNHTSCMVQDRLLPLGGKSWHWSSKFIFWYQNSAWKSDDNLWRAEGSKVELHGWTWTSFSSNSVSQSLGRNTYLRPPLR